MAETSIKLTPQAQALIQRLDRMPRAALEAIAREMRELNGLTVSHIQRKYLSYPIDGPSMADGLRAKTGSARRAVTAFPPVIGTNSVTSSIGGLATNKGVNYLAVHEFGATIPAHTVRPRNKKALNIPGIGPRKSANIPAITLPARGMIGRGITDMLPQYGERISAAVAETLNS